MAADSAGGPAVDFEVYLAAAKEKIALALCPLVPRVKRTRFFPKITSTVNKRDAEADGRRFSIAAKI